MSREEVLSSSRVPGKENVFFLGCFESRVTLYAQQVRALNLVDAIVATGKVRPNGRVAIVGAGAAGVTAAAAFALEMPQLQGIDLYDRQNVALHLQIDSPHRYLHPGRALFNSRSHPQPQSCDQEGHQRSTALRHKSPPEAPSCELAP